MSTLLFWGLNLINRRYQHGKYKKILNGINILRSNKEEYSTYVNLHRVFSLLQVDDLRWQYEFEYMQEKGQISLLGEEDAKYIAQYLMYISDGKLLIDNQMETLELSKVSNRTKKYFPMKMENLKKVHEQNKAPEDSVRLKLL